MKPTCLRYKEVSLLKLLNTPQTTLPIRNTVLTYCSNLRTVFLTWGHAVEHVVIGIFHWLNPSDRAMALRSTQPLTEMSTRGISWGGKGSRCVGLALPPSSADCHEILGASTSWSAALRADTSKKSCQIKHEKQFTSLRFTTLNNFANEDGRGNLTYVADRDVTVGFRIWPTTCFEFNRPGLK